MDSLQLRDLEVFFLVPLLVELASVPAVKAILTLQVIKHSLMTLDILLNSQGNAIVCQPSTVTEPFRIQRAPAMGNL